MIHIHIGAQVSMETLQSLNGAASQVSALHSGFSRDCQVNRSTQQQTPANGRKLRIVFPIEICSQLLPMFRESLHISFHSPKHTPPGAYHQATRQEPLADSPDRTPSPKLHPPGPNKKRHIKDQQRDGSEHLVDSPL